MDTQAQEESYYRKLDQGPYNMDAKDGSKCWTQWIQSTKVQAKRLRQEGKHLPSQKEKNH
jgi:hypothetical protein